MRNRLNVAVHRDQGPSKRVLCVCSAGVLRSPTAAMVLAEHKKYNTRAAGVSEDFALIYADQVLLYWAEEIVCMEAWQAIWIGEKLADFGYDETPVFNLNIPDEFDYMQPELVAEILSAYSKRKS